MSTSCTRRVSATAGISNESRRRHRRSSPESSPRHPPRHQPARTHRLRKRLHNAVTSDRCHIRPLSHSGNRATHCGFGFAPEIRLTYAARSLQFVVSQRHQWCAKTRRAWFLACSSRRSRAFRAVDDGFETWFRIGMTRLMRKTRRLETQGGTRVAGRACKPPDKVKTLRGAGERVLVMQAAEDGPRGYKLACGQPVTMSLRFVGDSRRRLRDRTQYRVRPPAVVGRRPFTNRRAQVAFAQRNDTVEAFAAKGSDEALAEGVRFWTARRRLEHGEPEGTGSRVERGREDSVTVVQQITPRMLGHDDLAQLLCGPCGGGMRRRVDVEDAAGADLHDPEGVDRAGRCRLGD